MSIPVNVKQDNEAGTGLKPWVVLDRYNSSYATINVTFDGVATATIEGTLERRPDNGLVGGDVFNINGLVDISENTVISLSQTPVSALRVNQTAGAGSVTIHILQATS